MTATMTTAWLVGLVHTLLAAAMWTGLEAQGADAIPSAGDPVPFHTDGVAPAKRWFDGAGLGLFVHGGIASVHGRAELSWSMIKNGPYRKDLRLLVPMTLQ